MVNAKYGMGSDAYHRLRVKPLPDIVDSDRQVRMKDK